MHRVLKLSALALLLLGSTLGWAKEALRVGVAPDYPPMSYRENGHLSGIDIAAAESIGKLMKRDIKFVEKKLPDLIPALQAGEIDIIMTGMAITPERSEQVSFTNSYLDSGQMAIIRFSDAGRLSFKGAMFRPGIKIAVEKNSQGALFAEQNLKNASIKTCDTVAEAFSKLEGGDVDFFIHDAPTSWALANDRNKQDLMSLNHALTEERLAWAVAKNNTQLQSSINQQLETLQRNGILKAIISKWIPVQVEVE